MPTKPTLQIASDIHLEFFQSPDESVFKTLVQPTQADILVLAGDIGPPDHPNTAHFFKWACAIWPEVIWVFGNHEHYNKIPMETNLDLGLDYMAAHPNLSVLENAAYDGRWTESDTLQILGTTMWTDLEPQDAAVIRRGLNDFRQIRATEATPFTPAAWNLKHQEAREFLEESLKNPIPTVVITHHLPSYRMILDEYQGSPLNAGFAAHCDDLLESLNLLAWICGHSHGQRTAALGSRNVPTILNARGYPGEQSCQSYNPSYTLTLKPLYLL